MSDNNIESGSVWSDFNSSGNSFIKLTDGAAALQKKMRLDRSYFLTEGFSLCDVRANLVNTHGSITVGMINQASGSIDIKIVREYWADADNSKGFVVVEERIISNE